MSYYPNHNTRTPVSFYIESNADTSVMLEAMYESLKKKL